MKLTGKVKDCMQTRVPSINVNDSVKNLIQKMLKLKSDYMVIKSNGEIVGVVTEKDILRALHGTRDRGN